MLLKKESTNLSKLPFFNIEKKNAIEEESSTASAYSGLNNRFPKQNRRMCEARHPEYKIYSAAHARDTIHVRCIQ